LKEPTVERLHGFCWNCEACANDALIEKAEKVKNYLNSIKERGMSNSQTDRLTGQINSRTPTIKLGQRTIVIGAVSLRFKPRIEQDDAPVETLSDKSPVFLSLEFGIRSQRIAANILEALGRSTPRVCVSDLCLMACVLVALFLPELASALALIGRSSLCHPK
jgi:hypothetical protein